MILGMDVGGTTSRCLLADRDGRRLGYGRAGGGNPVSHTLPEAVGSLRAAVRDALDGRDPSAIEHAVLGIAGLRDQPGSVYAVLDVFRGLGVTCPIDCVSDTEVAFAAGCPTGTGTVLIAGTGAVVADIDGYAERQSADGHGWLLGDRGSGFWIGREAVTATLTSSDRGRRSPLVDRVQEHFSSRGRHELIAAVHSRLPVRLSEVAPLVLDLMERGDPEARGIIERAAECLTASTGQVRPDGDERPIVLAGGVATHPMMAKLLAASLRERWPRAELTSAGDGTGGAVWLALQRVRGDISTRVHDLLTRSPGPEPGRAGQATRLLRS